MFTSGQIPLDPATGAVVEGRITEQAHQSMKNVKAVLEAAGADFNHCGKDHMLPGGYGRLRGI